MAESLDGLTFNSKNINISHPYFRYFEYESNVYGIAMKGHIGQIVYKFENNKFVDYCDLLPKTRHCHVKYINNKLYVFYSIVGDCP
jgi:hypothetical protein